MALKELKLDLEAMLSQVVNGKGFLHYGYWDGMDPDGASLADVGRAQQQYFELLQGYIGAPPRTVLDVGSGTGANAAELQSLGYSVECLCPSSRLNALARAKLKPSTVVHEMTFEAFSPDRGYDVVLFAESFHYIDLVSAVEQLKRLTPKTIVIFDYFSRQSERHVGAERSTRRSVEDVLTALQSTLPGYRMTENRDTTEQIAPTFDVLAQLNRQHVAPFVEELRAALKAERPFLGRVVNYVLGRLYKGARGTGTPSRADEFKARYEYRLIVLNQELVQ